MKNLSITRVVLTFLFFSTSRSYSQNLIELANRDIISTYYWTDTSFRPYLIKLNYNLSSSFNLDSLNARITAIPINNNIFKKFAYVEKAYKEYSSILLKKYAIGFAHRDSIVNLSLLNGYSNILEVSSYWKAKTQNEYFPNDFKFVPFNFKNDTSFYSLRSFYEHLNNINAPKAWTISTGHPKITIGIVDNGVQNQPGYHPTKTLGRQMKTFLVNGNQNSNINTSEHGTQVASLIFTLNDNSEYNSSICGFQGKINGRFASLFSPGGGMGALKFLAKIKGVRVINCSWVGSLGACTYFLSDQIAINELVDSHKVSLVFAAGNGESINCGKTAYNYPASYDSVLSVSAIGYLDPVGFLRYPNASTSWVNSHYNKRGSDDITTQYNDKVDIVAPGHEMPVLTPTLYNLCGITSVGTLGSSLSAPLVSGTLGLMYSIDPCLSPMQAHTIIRNSANPDIYALPINAPYIGKLGTGRLDVFKALQATMRQGTNFQQNVDYTNNQTILGRTMILAGNNVNHPTRSVGDVNIKANRHIVYQANIGVELSSGFVVEDKASFEIVIQDSPCY